MTEHPPQPLAPPAPQDIARDIRPLRSVALAAAAVGLGLLAVGLLFLVDGDKQQAFFRSYLWAVVFWLGIPLGSLGLLMLQHLTGGRWGLVTRRLLEAGTRMLPAMLVLFVPVLIFGMADIYDWYKKPGEILAVHAEGVVNFKGWWLQPAFFLVRAAVYFGFWLLAMLLLNTWSDAQDRGGGDPGPARRMGVFSGPGLVALVLTVTFAVFDWVMSIDAHWFSTIYGLIFIVGQGLATLALAIIVLALIHRAPPLRDVVTRDHFHDLGTLMFAFTMLWAYMQFSQFLIIWMGNIREETPFYIVRSHGLAGALSVVLLVAGFFVPFLALLSRYAKRSVRMLVTAAVLILVMRVVDVFWLVKPAFAQHGLVHHGTIDQWWSVLDLATPLAVGGVFLWLFTGQVGRRPLLPPNDPRLAEALAGGHH